VTKTVPGAERAIGRGLSGPTPIWGGALTTWPRGPSRPFREHTELRRPSTRSRCVPVNGSSATQVKALRALPRRVCVYVTRMPRAGIYARISSDRDGQQLGVRRQLEDCERLAERKGWQVVERYIDDDVSAYNGHQRPDYRRMLATSESGLIDVGCLAPRPTAPPAQGAGGVLRGLRPSRRP